MKSFNSFKASALFSVSAQNRKEEHEWTFTGCLLSRAALVPENTAVVSNLWICCRADHVKCCKIASDSGTGTSFFPQWKSRFLHNDHRCQNLNSSPVSTWMFVTDLKKAGSVTARPQLPRGEESPTSRALGLLLPDHRDSAHYQLTHFHTHLSPEPWANGWWVGGLRLVHSQNSVWLLQHLQKQHELGSKGFTWFCAHLTHSGPPSFKTPFFVCVLKQS